MTKVNLIVAIHNEYFCFKLRSMYILSLFTSLSLTYESAFLI